MKYHGAPELSITNDKSPKLVFFLSVVVNLPTFKNLTICVCLYQMVVRLWLFPAKNAVVCFQSPLQ